MPIPRIAIIGAGPAGLTLGVLLQSHNIPFAIYELRPQPSPADLAQPSGMLDLHEESGLAALMECGLYDTFLKYTGECTESQKVSDKDGNILYADEGEMSHRPEISRHALTKVLASALAPGAVKWEHKLLRVTTSTDGEAVLDFDHATHTADLVIGADGAWSAVRNLLTPIKPIYTGMQNITATIRHISTKYPHLETLLGKGSFSALAFKNGVMSHRGPQDSARLYIMFNTPDEQFGSSTGLAGRSAADAKEMLLTDDKLYGRWGTAIKELVGTACTEDAADHPTSNLDIKPLYMLPIGVDWTHSTQATLIGDAAHLSTPWAGEGVNLAMWDSLLLAKVIITAYERMVEGDDDSFHVVLDPLMRDFEMEMVARAKEKSEEAQRNGQMLFGDDDGARAFADFFRSVYQ